VSSCRGGARPVAPFSRVLALALPWAGPGSLRCFWCPLEAEACQVWIEQRIEEELSERGETGKSLREIGRELAAEIERVFEAKVNPETLRSIARRSGGSIDPKETNAAPAPLSRGDTGDILTPQRVVEDVDRLVKKGRSIREAARMLGWENIAAVVMDGDMRACRLWEIAENLHRAELSDVERSKLIEEWRELTVEKVSQVETPLGGAQPHDVGVSKTAQELGITRDEVRRAHKIATIAPEALEAARELGLDNNQSALLEAAREATAEGKQPHGRGADRECPTGGRMPSPCRGDSESSAGRTLGRDDSQGGAGGQGTG